MSAILITTIQSWTGTRDERLGLSTTGINAGSNFEETDTNLKYKWDGSAWYLDPAESVSLSTLIAGEDQTNDVLKVEQQFTYKNLAANANTSVKSTPGFLHALVINKIGASSNTITVYDGTDATGTVIATIDSTIAGAPTRIFDVSFTTGLYVAIATGTAPDITISYR
jgi:hypothetical protein